MVRICLIAVMLATVGCQEHSDAKSDFADADISPARSGIISETRTAPALNKSSADLSDSPAMASLKRRKRPKRRLVLPDQMTPEQKIQFEAHQANLRAKHYRRQRVLPIPTVVVQRMTGVVPPGMEHKTTGYEIHHNMELVRVKSDRMYTKLRWVTPMRGPALRDAISQSLTASGWVLNAHFFDRGDSVHPDRGRLRIELVEPAERSTTVTATVEKFVQGMPVENPLGRISFPLPWAQVITEQPEGYELTHFRDVHAGASFTDIERVAVAYRPTHRDDFKIRIRQAAMSANFKGRGPSSKKLVGPDGSSVLPLDTDAHHVVVHAMRQYGDPRVDPRLKPQEASAQ